MQKRKRENKGWHFRAATVNLSQARPNTLRQIFLTSCFLWEPIETQNLSKSQVLGALGGVAAMHLKNFFIFPLYIFSFL